MDEKHSSFSWNFMTERVGDTPGLTQLYVPIPQFLSRATLTRLLRQPTLGVCPL